MIELLTGENNFELTRALRRREHAFEGTPERYEASDLHVGQMADLVTGQTLFAAKRLVVIDTPSANTELWHQLPDWLSRTANDTHLILVEAKPDKRTATYKWLKKHVSVEEFMPWTSRDAAKAEEWLRVEAKRLGVTLTHQIAKLLIARVGLDQWQLYHALEKIALLPEITESAVTTITDARPDENVFELFDTALRGDQARLAAMIARLEETEDPYRVFGLLSGQIMQLAALALGGKGGRDVAGDLGASPFMLNKLSVQAARMDQARVREMLQAAAYADRRLKSTAANPWTLIEHMLSRLAQV